MTIENYMTIEISNEYFGQNKIFDNLIEMIFIVFKKI